MSIDGNGNVKTSSSNDGNVHTQTMTSDGNGNVQMSSSGAASSFSPYALPVVLTVAIGSALPMVLF